jgi:hypothetical protein
MVSKGEFPIPLLVRAYPTAKEALNSHAHHGPFGVKVAFTAILF